MRVFGADGPAPLSGDMEDHPACASGPARPEVLAGGQDQAADIGPQLPQGDGAGDDAAGDGVGVVPNSDAEGAGEQDLTPDDWLANGDSESEASSLESSDLEGLSVGDMLHWTFFGSVQRAKEPELLDLEGWYGNEDDALDDSENAGLLRELVLWERDVMDETRLTDTIRERALPTFLAAAAHVRTAWLRSQGVHSLRAFAALLGEHGGGATVQRTRGKTILEHERVLTAWAHRVATGYTAGSVALENVQPGGAAPSWERLVAEYIDLCAPPMQRCGP